MAEQPPDSNALSSSLPSWKVRLLERIHDISAAHVRVLDQAYPRYELDDGQGDVPVLIWRAQLRTLEVEREDLVEQALGVGVPTDVIYRASEAGAHGVGWERDASSSATNAPGEDLARKYLVERIANDIWRLEHMAVLSADHLLRELDSTESDARQFDRNMHALWNRVNDTAGAIGVRDEERTELWGRDEAGWLRLAAVTVRGYLDSDLQERWRAYAWAGIEHAAARSREFANLDPTVVAERGAAPPIPQALIGCATRAITELAGQQHDSNLSAAAEGTREAPVTVWEPAPAIRPPEPGAGAGHDL
ncbi:hypothetical protein K7711_36550 [Nocardia sp. CA2R105]|uniref:hypothetical protein n=1 Tax=Nocardia coffeae TaxID=2873381 RepID=UPI001CA6472E|nr:hypothetical protein [Nocardia coffeae]MBY8862035.1 hypothetical protein [Nocardia coffeae]